MQININFRAIGSAVAKAVTQTDVNDIAKGVATSGKFVGRTTTSAVRVVASKVPHRTKADEATEA